MSYCFAGTTAKVSFVLTGDKDETQPRFLADDKRPVLQTSNTDGFVMAVPKSLGKLTHLRLLIFNFTLKMYVNHIEITSDAMSHIHRVLNIIDL